MAEIIIAENITVNGDTTPVLVTREMRSTYGEIVLGVTGTFDSATVEARISTDDAGVNSMFLGVEANLIEPKGIALNIPSDSDVYLYLSITGSMGAMDISAVVYV